MPDSATRLNDGELLAAIDLGSNSFHMVVARYMLGQLRTVDRLREVVRLADGLDGAVARASGRASTRGAFLDISLDFVFYALVPLGFALADPEANALAAAVLIAGFVGTGSSFLAFAAVAGQQGITAPRFPTKGIYYLGGLTEGFETIVFFVLICLFPDWFAPLAYGFALACAATTVARWHQGWVAFSVSRS